MGFRKLLMSIFFLFFLVGCRKEELSGPIIQKCFVDGDQLVAWVNNNYKIGEANEFGVGHNGGMLKKVKTYKQDDVFVVTTNMEVRYENYVEGETYKICIKWIGGCIEAEGKYESDNFQITQESYFNKGAF